MRHSTGYGRFHIGDIFQIFIYMFTQTGYTQRETGAMIIYTTCKADFPKNAYVLRHVIGSALRRKIAYNECHRMISRHTGLKSMLVSKVIIPQNVDR